MQTEALSYSPQSLMTELDLLMRSLKAMTPTKRQRAISLLSPETVSGLNYRKAQRSLRHFLRFWTFTDREGSGRWLLGDHLWPSQAEVAALVDAGVKRFCLMKSGKLGDTEVCMALACWRGVFAPSGARVHLFSATADDAWTLLDILRVGLRGLPPAWGVRIAEDERYGDTVRSLKVRCADGETRTFASYAPRKTASISESAIHVHLDELAHMQWGDGVYNSAVTTVPADGTLVVLSRGHGIENYMADLWEKLVPEGSTYADAHAHALARVAAEPTTMVPLFQPYTMRPGRDEAWRNAQAETMTPAGLRWYAPEVPEDALAGDADSEFVAIEQWDALDVIEPLAVGDRTPLVLGLDAGVRDDYTALVGVTRHPERHEETAIRFVQEWRPNPVTDFADIRATIRRLRAEYNVVCVGYDAYALQEMAEDMGRESYWELFDQGRRRLLADKGLRDAIVQRRIARSGGSANDILRLAVRAAGIKTGTEDGTLRIVKRASGKIDALIALSMSRHVALDLNL